MAAAFIGVTAGVAVKATWWSPCQVILAVSGLAYLLGLSNYGVAEEGTPDDADTGTRCGPRPARENTVSSPSA